MEIITKQSKSELSQRKLEGFIKLAEIVQYGRKNPVKFCERFYGIEFLDNQKYVFMMSWVTPFNVWCQSRGSGKTTMLAPFIMAKTNLIPNFQAYIMSGVGSQAQEAFLKIEKIAKKEIASFTGLTDVFYNETVKSAANTDGFTHNPASFQYKLYNGSALNSLNGSFDNNRSKRSNLNVYDESGFAPEELFITSLPFITQDSNFKLGGDIDVNLMPKEFPNQAIFASSASSTDTYFYKVYKDYAKKMFIGDKRYFVADINAEIVINATYNGKKYPVGLLKQEVIDDAMRKNKEKALREYYNKFSTEGGENQAIRRATIIRNSEMRVPKLYNDSKSTFVMAYDPARSYDNAVCMVGEIYYDENVGYKMRICNGVSFVDISKKKKTPMRTPEQVAHIKQMILDYNGKEAADFENVTLMIDSGAGGGGHIIADEFMEDWVDTKGITHRGLIDKVESTDYVRNFPNAVDNLKLMSPKKYKNEMFDALVEMLGLDLISFTEEYDMKGHLTLFEDTEIEYEDDKKNKKKETQVNQKVYKLSFDEELALKNIDLAKEELVNIYRFDSPSGGYRYNLSPDKETKMHDDRAYCVAMLAWYLQQLRRKNITQKSNSNANPLDFLFIN
jgi:hypothetical protein